MSKSPPALALSNSPVGVEAALIAASDSSFMPRPTLLEKEFSLRGRVAVVTGGQRGLGLDMAAALAEAGACVYCLATTPEPIEVWKKTQLYISRLGLIESARLEYASVDISDQEAISTVLEDIVQKEGRLDVCVASAGIIEVRSCLDLSAELFEKQINVNVNGTFFTVQAAARQMVKLGIPGSIVIISSIAGNVALKGQSTVAYGASKSAGVQMARSMACELGRHRIRVNALSPGYIPTELNLRYLAADPALRKEWESQNPLGRLGVPSELRGVITWLASDASSFCTGSDIIVDGGHCAW